MPLERLVDIHGVEARHIEARNPHVDHNGNLEVGIRVLEIQGSLLSVFVRTKQVIKFRHIILVAGHDEPDAVAAIQRSRLRRHGIIVVLFLFLRGLGHPMRTQGDNLFV